jgi:hypothetical protein
VAVAVVAVTSVPADPIKELRAQPVLPGVLLGKVKTVATEPVVVEAVVAN